MSSKARQPEQRPSREKNVDPRALRFAIGFPILLALAFTLAVQVAAKRLPAPMAYLWNAEGALAFTSVTGYTVLGAALIIVPAWPLMIAASLTRIPVLIRRILLSLGMALSLFMCTVAAAGIAGQIDIGDARGSHVDNLVLLLGAGGSLALALLIHYLFNPDPQWDPADDRALGREMDVLNYPALARVPRPIWTHPRTSVVVMILLAFLFPGGMLAVINPWIPLGAAIAAVLVLALLSFRIRIGTTGLSIRMGGLVPLVRIGSAQLLRARTTQVQAQDYGGWGPRQGPRGRSLLASSGAAVVVESSDASTPKVTFSMPDEQSASDVAAALSQLSQPPGAKL